MKTPLQTISYLKTSNELKRNKYRRNIRKYYGTPAIDLDNSSYVVGWNYLLNGDMMPTQLNVIKSIIDTLVSKIAQSNVRPYFNKWQLHRYASSITDTELFRPIVRC